MVAVALVVKVRIEVKVGVPEGGVMLAVTPAGRPGTDNETCWAKPSSATVAVTATLWPWKIVAEVRLRFNVNPAWTLSGNTTIWVNGAPVPGEQARQVPLILTW